MCGFFSGELWTMVGMVGLVVRDVDNGIPGGGGLKGGCSVVWRVRGFVFIVEMCKNGVRLFWSIRNKDEDMKIKGIMGIGKRD